MTELFFCACSDYLSTTSPKNGETVTVKVRVKGTGKVYVEYSEQLFNVTKNDYEIAQTEFLNRAGEYEYRIAKITLGSNNIRFHFVCSDKTEKFIYDAGGKNERADKTRDFILTPDFDTPHWSKGALWYQIMPDSYFNGNVLNDKGNSGLTKENAWGNTHCDGGNDYFGGDFDGIINKLDYIASLGVTAISINPVWIATHNAGYGTDDLTDVDACFGGDDGLKRLIAEVHKRGMKICLDGVFDYIVPKAKWYNEEGLYPLSGGVKSGDPFYDIYLRDQCGRTIPSFWGQPLIDFSSDKARALIYKNEDSIVKTYLKQPYGIDAWRMDVGNIYEGSDPEHFGNSVDVMRDMRDNIKQVNPNALLITENDLPKMRAYAVNDSKWNYELGGPVREWSAKKLKASEFRKLADENTKSLPVAVANSCFNHITTHDTARIYNTAKGDKVAVMAATLFNMTFIGAPSIYFGDETGTKGTPYPSMGEAAPTSFASMNWFEGDFDEEILSLYRNLGKIRSSNPEFWATSGYEFVYENDESSLLGVVRFKNGEVKIIVLNQQNTPQTITLDLSAYGINGDYTDYLSGRVAHAENGQIELLVFPGGAVYGKNGCSNLIDGFICKDVRKNIFGGYEIKGSLSYNTFGSFYLKVNGDFGSLTHITVGDLQIKIKNGQVFADEIFIGKLTNNIIEIQRNQYVCISVDGVALFECKKVMPSAIAIDIVSDNALLTIFKESKPLPLKADFSEYAGNFFAEKVGCLENGKLVLTDEQAYLPLRADDFTFSAIFNGNGGVFVSDEKQKLLFTKQKDTLKVLLNGVVLSEQPITEEISLLKLEKCGVRYNLIALCKDKEIVVEQGVRFNISQIYLGIIAFGRCEFSSVWLGNGIDAKRHYSPSSFSLSTDTFSRDIMPPKYRIVKGNLTSCYAGYAHAEEQPVKLSIDGLYGDFTLIFSVLYNENAEVKVKTSLFSVQLFKNEIKLFSSKLKRVKAYLNDADEKRNFMLVRRKNTLFVYENDCLIANMLVPTGDITPLIIGVGNFELTNLSIQRTDYSYFIGRGKVFPMREGLDISSEWQESAYVRYERPLQNFAYSANVKFNRSASVNEGFFSVGFGAKVGAYPASEGLNLRFFKETSKAELLLNGKTIAEGKINCLDNESFYLVIINIDGKVKIYVAPNEFEKKCDLLIEADTGMKEGGCLYYYNLHTRSLICNARLISVCDFSDADELLDDVKIAPSKHRYMI